MRIPSLAFAAGAIFWLIAPPADANGRFPASNQLVFSPTDANLVVLRTTYGILLSHDAGGTWRWLCEDVLGVEATSKEDPSLALTAGGSLVSGAFAGLAVSPDTGCSWGFARGPLAHQYVKDVTVRPDQPHVVLALTSTYGADAAAGGSPGYAQQIYASDDDGIGWAALGSPIDPTAIGTSLEVAPSDRNRLYVSAIRDQPKSASLFVSTDAGNTWTEQPVPIDTSRESVVYIGAVDPIDANRVYLRTGPTSSRLLVTSDAGRTFQAPLSFDAAMLGFALSPDGSKVYAGSPDQGLFAATRDGLSFQHVSPIHVQCLAAHGADLWACADEPSGFIAGVSVDDGATFTAKAHLVAEPLIACRPDASAQAQCGGAPWQAFCASLGCDSLDAGNIQADAAVDAEAVDAEVDASATPAAAAPAWLARGGGGCSSATHETGSAALAAASAFAGITVWRARRARRGIGGKH